MRGLRGVEGGRALAAVAVAVVAVAGLAVLVPAGAGPGLPPAHADQGGAGGEPGMIVVADWGNNRLQAFYPDGTFAFKFGAGYGRAQSIDVGPDGMIVVAGQGSRVVAFHPNGTFALGVTHGGEGVGLVHDRPKAAVAPDGRIVVADSSRIQVFEPDGTFASVFGVPRDVSNPEYWSPRDVGVAPDGRIVVLDRSSRCESADGRDRIVILYPNGTLALSFRHTLHGWSYCQAAHAVAVGADGRIVVAGGDDGGVFWVYRPLPNGTFARSYPNGTTYPSGPNGTVAAVSDIQSARWGYHSGIAVGPDGEIVVGGDDNHVRVFHPNGTRALTFGGYGSVQGGFDRPTDAAVAPDGRIVVAEPGNRTISVFHPNGTLDFAFGKYGHGDDAFYEPHHVAVGPDGRIVVGDTRKHRILVFEPDGTPALAFGSYGEGAGQIIGIRDVAVGPNGSVVVVDNQYRYGYYGNRVQVFSPDGTLVHALYYDGAWVPDKVAVAPDGRIVVAADGSYFGAPPVHVFDPNGTEAFTIWLDRDESVVAVAVAVAVGPDGRIVVVQGSRSQVFNPDGTFAFATEIDVDAVSVAVGPSREIVVVDDDADRVQVFNPNGTFAFALLPDVSQGKFNGVGPVAVGPVMPHRFGDPEPLWAVVEEPDVEGAPILRNFTGAGDAANVTIDVAALAGGPGGADALNGSESSTVTFPASNTTVIASFAEVTFPPNVTASHVPAGGLLGLRVATLVPTAEQVQAALGRSANGSGPERVVILQSVVEVGGDQSRIVFDLPIRIALEGQAGGRAFYIEGPNGTIVPIDLACAADGVDAVHRQLDGVDECQMDSADGTAKIIYTYHLTKFGTVSAEGPVPGIVVDPVPAQPPTFFPGGGGNSTNGTAAPPVVVVVPDPGFVPFGGGGGNGTNGTVAPPPPPQPAPPPPPPVVVPGPGPAVVVPPTAPGHPTCSVYLASPEIALSAMPGKHSEPFIQEVVNAGTLSFAQVEIKATPWQDAAMPLPAVPRMAMDPGISPPGVSRAPSVFTAYLLATMPASVTEVREEPREPRVVDGVIVAGGGGGQYMPLADGTAVVLDGLEAGNWAELSFRLNLTPYDALQGGTLTQSITYQAECVEPAVAPPPPAPSPAQ